MAAAMSDFSNVDYFEQSISSIDVVQRLSTDQTVQLNPRQCKYLSDRLTETGGFLRAKSESLISVRDSADTRHKALLQLYFAVRRAEKLVRGCCCEREPWLDSAVTLAHVKEDIKDILLDVRWWTSMIDIAIASRRWPRNSSGQKAVLELVMCAEEHYRELLNNLHMNNNELEMAASRDEDLLLRKVRDVEASHAGRFRTAEQNHDYLLAVHVRSRLENCEAETEEGLNAYEYVGLRGQGGFGAVLDVKWMKRRCALKMLKQKCSDEATSLREFDHPHIVKFFRYWETSCVHTPHGTPHSTPHGTPRSDDPMLPYAASQSHILMELMPMDLAEHLKSLRSMRYFTGSRRRPEQTQGASLPEDVALDAMLQMVKAMWHLNSKDVAHRDLKPNNVLVRPVSDDEVPELNYRGYVRAKLADFGLAKTKALSSALSTQPAMGTKIYGAPEVFNKDIISKKKYPRKADVWSFGVMFCEVYSGKAPYPGIEDGTITLAELQRKIKEGLRPWLPENCPDYLRFIISSCWELQPEDRPNFSDLLRLVRLAQVQNLGLIQKDHDLYFYESRNGVRRLCPKRVPKNGDEGSSGASINTDYLEQLLRALRRTKKLVQDKILEINVNVCRDVISKELDLVEDLLISHRDNLLVRDKIGGRRRVALTHLYAQVKKTENFVQQCCQSDGCPWPERALSMYAIKEDVTDIVLHLRWWSAVVDLVTISVLNPQWTAPSEQQRENNRLRKANKEFQEALNVLLVFDIMESSSRDVQMRERTNERKATIDKIVEQGGPYREEFGTKEHLDYILAWPYNDPEAPTYYPPRQNFMVQRADHDSFREIFLRCVDLQNAVNKDKKHLVEKAVEFMGSYTCESGSPEHRAYLLAIQLHSLLTDVEVNDVPELNKYEGKYIIGKGSAVVVQRVTWCGQECVLKKILINPNFEDQNEVKSLKRLPHPHIVKFYRHWVAPPDDDEKLSLQSHIVMEHMPLDLARHMENLKNGNQSSSSASSSGSSSSLPSPSSNKVVEPFPGPVAVDIMLQLAKAMWHMHCKSVVHRDLKPSNVLVRPVSPTDIPELSAQGFVQVKLCDFGTVKGHMLSSDSQLFMSESAGTSLYHAPELSPPISTLQKLKSLSGCKQVVQIKYPKKADMWSFGVMSSQILTGEEPYPTHRQNLSNLAADVKKGLRPKLPVTCPDYLKFCIESCWKDEPTERPKFTDIWRMLRIANLRSLGLITQNFDWFRYKDRTDHVVGLNVETFLSNNRTRHSARANGLEAGSDLNDSPKKGNSGFFSCYAFGSPKPTKRSGMDMHFISPHRQPFGYLVNRVWPREESANWNLDVIFFEGNVGGRKGLSCRDTWLQRFVPRVCWPRDWLPEDLKTDIRVLMLEYCISDKGIAGLVNDIKKHLIFSERWNQKRTWKKPICLVGHSIGCSVIQALVLDLVGLAKQLKNSQSPKDIKKAETAEVFLTSLRGCFFYAYPAEGLLRSKSFMTEVFGGLKFSEELFVKEFWKESENNKERTKEFLYWCRTQVPTKYLMAANEGALTKGRLMVGEPPSDEPKKPPNLDIHIRRYVRLSDSNHIDICKPKEKSHPAYNAFLNFLRKKVAPELRNGI